MGKVGEGLTYALMQVDGVFACDHIGDGGAGGGGLFGRRFGFRRHFCRCRKQIGLVAGTYEEDLERV